MPSTCNVLNSSGAAFAVTNTVLNSSGVGFDVSNTVLNSDGTPFVVCISADTGFAGDDDYVDEYVYEKSVAELDDEMLLKTVIKFMKSVV